MLNTSPQSLYDLTQRTRFRNGTVWVGLLAGTALAEDEALVNALHRDMVEDYLALTDEVFQVKEYERTKSIEQSQAEVDQELFLADAKAATERQKIAIRIAADDYLFAARVYDAQVRSIIMLAKEYAASVELEQLSEQAKRTQLAIDKEAVHLVEVETKIEIEGIQRAMVQADLARNQLEVAKAGVQVLEANIAAEKAELEIIDAEVDEAMAVVTLATLQADVAMILAEIVMKQLSKVKLAVEKEEITDGFAFIQSKLNDLLTIWGVKDRIEALKTKGAGDILDETVKLLSAEEADQDLKLVEMGDAQAVQAYDVNATGVELTAERGLRFDVVKAREGLQDAEENAKVQILDKRTWAEKLINAAQVGVYRNHQISTVSTTRSTEYISGA
jgi:hypothetical protein